MPLRDIAAQNASLDNDYGAGHGAAAPDSHQLALFNGDPMFDDATELTGPNLPRALVPNDGDWPDCDDGAKERLVQFGEAVAELELEITHWALIDPATEVMWDTSGLARPVMITAAGPGPAVLVKLFHPDTQDLF